MQSGQSGNDGMDAWAAGPQPASTGACSPVIERYEAIAAVSQAMLEAARREDWDEVERQEQRCRILVAAARADQSGRLAPADDRRRMELLRRMLKDDAEIRDRASPWLQQFARFVSGAVAPRTR